MSVAEKLGHLRLILGTKQGLTEKEYLKAPGLEDGTLPRGVVIEILGNYKTEWAAQFIALHPELKVFWADKTQTVLPTALHQRGVQLSQVTFATLEKDFVQPLRRAIQSQVYGIILAPNIFEEIKIFQAFQLFTEKSNSTLILFGQDKPSTAWPISLQLEIHKGPNENNNFEIEILKQRHGKHL